MNSILYLATEHLTSPGNIHHTWHQTLYSSTKTYTHHAFRRSRILLDLREKSSVRLPIKLRPLLSMADQYTWGWVVFNVSLRTRIGRSRDLMITCLDLVDHLRSWR
ncbi:hypothetical protein VTL71DRAFT_1193 [Oculimacula yallundae]|uniref:Uncharacterized protein n=1 Tax=Oculimacula yallundae TaxID=86028 RepID=A0ABR4D2C8_9HELO